MFVPFCCIISAGNTETNVGVVPQTALARVHEDSHVRYHTCSFNQRHGHESGRHETGGNVHSQSTGILGNARTQICVPKHGHDTRSKNTKRLGNTAKDNVGGTGPNHVIGSQNTKQLRCQLLSNCRHDRCCHGGKRIG